MIPFSLKLKAIEIQGMGISVGSRAHLDETSKAERKFYRKIFSSISNFIV